jgi:peptide-methionine (R)-S-oxide reductase
MGKQYGVRRLDCALFDEACVGLLSKLRKGKRRRAAALQRAIFYVLMPVLLSGCTEKETPMKQNFPIQKTDAEWKKVLSPEQYRVLREAGTERPFSGIYTDNDKPGVYRCAACGAELFTSGSKFHSGCGWPSFDSAAKMGTVIFRPDNSLGMTRTEVLCANCGSHLGHLFDDGPTATGMRYCINSEALKFEEK